MIGRILAGAVFAAPFLYWGARQLRAARSTPRSINRILIGGRAVGLGLFGLAVAIGLMATSEAVVGWAAEISIGLLGMIVLGTIANRLARPHRGQERLVVDDVGVARKFPDGRVESVRWADLTEVGVVTSDEGPWTEDVFFVLISSDGKSGCAVPQHLAKPALLARLQDLPGFDNAALIQAMGSTENARFTCWRREG